MLKMKKLIFTVAVVIAAFSANAQKSSDLKFSVGAEIGAVTGNLNTAYSAAIGATAQADYNVQTDLALTLNTGVIILTGKNVGNNLKVKSATLIPLLIGAKYYFTPKAYGAAQLGTSLNAAKGAGSVFTYVAGVGYKFTEQIDALLKYTGYSGDGGTFGIRLGFTL
jgi:hypothetical protein